MTQLNQVLAIEKGVKNTHTRVITDTYHRLQKGSLWTGETRTYEPTFTADGEEPERRPAQESRVQATVRQAVEDIRGPLARLFDIVYEKDATNQVSKADITVDGAVLATGVPATYLLFLEKQLTDLRTLINTLPVLDPAYRWEWDQDAGVYRSAPTTTQSQKVVKKALVLYPATDKHPAQTQPYDETVTVGNWTVTNFSGAMSAEDRKALDARIGRLLEVVKQAREKANQTEVVDSDRIGATLVDYIFRQ
jgi:hypothetical protein